MSSYLHLCSKHVLNLLGNNNNNNNKDFIERGGPVGFTSNLPWGPHLRIMVSCSAKPCARWFYLIYVSTFPLTSHQFFMTYEQLKKHG